MLHVCVRVCVCYKSARFSIGIGYFAVDAVVGVQVVICVLLVCVPGC